MQVAKTEEKKMGGDWAEMVKMAKMAKMAKTATATGDDDDDDDRDDDKDGKKWKAEMTAKKISDMTGLPQGSIRI